MRIILSRKGFDSAAGGGPSPVFPDGTLLSLPIPDPESMVCYDDIRWGDGSLGALVEALSAGRVSRSQGAHLDPDLRAESLPRDPGWRPLFGQRGAAQGHLRRQGVGAGDLFLFFGLFRDVVPDGGRWRFRPGAPLRHVLWGWLQIGEVLKVAAARETCPTWAAYHPHYHGRDGSDNTLYVAAERLALPGVGAGTEDIPGAGVFTKASEARVLTAPGALRPTDWALPAWCHPHGEHTPLTYHGDLRRWARDAQGTRLSAAPRGQEFVLDSRAYAESHGWVRTLFVAGAGR